MHRKNDKDLAVKSQDKLNWTPEQVDLIKRTVARDCTDDELKLFLYVCTKTSLDPFMKQIYAVKRKGVMTIQTSIDGLRLIADRSGNYSPGREPSYVYDDKGGLLAATSYLKKRTSDGVWHEISSTAFLVEFRPSYHNNFWSQMPHVMLAKCAESAALRKAFPAEMSGLYTEEEMSQAPNPKPEETITGEQAEEIMSLLGNDNAVLCKVLNYYKVESIRDIKTSRFDEIVSRLKRNQSAEVVA